MKRNFILSLIALFVCASSVKADNDLYERMVLIEEFTTEKCPNCPSCAALLEEVMALPEYEGRLIATTHHSGFYTDWLTTVADTEYKWFYNYKSTYAPAIMFDRYPFFETKGRPGTDQRKPTPVATINTMNNFKKYINRRLDTKAHVGFYLTGEYDNDKNIKVRVSGVRDSLFSESAPRITVFLVENNIKAQNQAGAGSDYHHNHVLRTYNSIWGDVINWNGDKFDYECDLKLQSEWNKDNIQVIAFVHAYDSEDPGKCSIENARIINFETILGIEDAAVNNELVKTEYFTVDGVKADAKAHGLYIEKKTYSDGTVETKKINR